MGILYRFDVLVALGGFDPELKFEDWDLLLRLTKKHKINRLPDKLFLYRIHATNMTLDTAMMQETTASLMKKHSDFAAFNALKADLRQKPLRALLRHWRNYDLGLRVISRRLFTNHGIQGEAVPAAILSLLPLLAGLARMRVSATLNRLVGVRLGQQCKVGGRLKISGNRRNLRIGANVIFEGDAEFILPRGVGQGHVVIGDSCVIAQGALFNCISGDLFLGPSSYVGRNVVLQSNGDLRIGAWTLIEANAGLYASNQMTSGKDQPIWTQGNSFTGISIGQNCWIGHGGVVVDGVNLGENSIVEPNTLVRGVHGPSSRLQLRID
jgi:acetyltransferase-like isoleucine patch superfamily enzyme